MTGGALPGRRRRRAEGRGPTAEGGCRSAVATALDDALNQATPRRSRDPARDIPPWCRWPRSTQISNLRRLNSIKSFSWPPRRPNRHNPPADTHACSYDHAGGERSPRSPRSRRRSREISPRPIPPHRPAPRTPASLPPQRSRPSSPLTRASLPSRKKSSRNTGPPPTRSPPTRRSHGGGDTSSSTSADYAKAARHRGYTLISPIIIMACTRCQRAMWTTT